MRDREFDFWCVLLAIRRGEGGEVTTRPAALAESESEAWLAYHNVLAKSALVEKRLLTWGWMQGWRIRESDYFGSPQAPLIPPDDPARWRLGIGLADATLWISTVVCLGVQCGVEQWAIANGFLSPAIVPPLGVVLRTPALSVFTADGGLLGERQIGLVS